MTDSDPINVGGVGGLSMWPEETLAAAKTVSDAGQTFGAAWTGLRASILAAETRVGQGLDEMSVAFRQSYNASAEHADPAASGVQGVYEGLSTVATKLVALYRQADQSAAGRFRSSG